MTLAIIVALAALFVAMLLGWVPPVRPRARPSKPFPVQRWPGEWRGWV